VSGVAEGDRVAYFDAPLGAYADAHIVPADRLVPLPPGIGDELAASLMLKGLTAEYLVRRTYAVARGDVVVVTAAAGGVGQLLCQWLRHIGATVVAVVGSESKAGLLRARGLDTVLTPDEDLPEVVRKVSGGHGARVVYDGVGQSTWNASLDSLARFGLMVSFGMASGPVGPIDLAALQSRGSLFVTRPSVFDHMARRDDLIAASSRLFDLVSEGVIAPQAPTRFALADAAQAHQALEDRATTGAIVLTTA
jgi:NADPH2:quinone reductase